MSSRWIALAMGAVLLASQEAKAACVIHGARPTVPLPTMLHGQEFSFIASPDCETLRFTIRGTRVSKIPTSGRPVGPAPHTYKVVLTEREWNAVVAESGSTITWVVTGKTSAGVTTRLVTTNDLKRVEPNRIDLSTADAKLLGELGSIDTGWSVSGTGDVNGDGHDDVLVGARFIEVDGTLGFGAAYMVLGPVTGTLDLSLADARLVGEGQYDEAGRAVSGAGDIDGDGNDDILVGAPVHDPSGGGTYEGAGYLVLGPVTGTVDLSLADAKFVGEESLDWAGLNVSAAGDVDGNGHDDLLIGAGANDEGGADAGAAYLVLGPVTGTRDLSLANAKFVGERQFDYAGGHFSDPPTPWTSVASAGDTNADGHDDVLVGGGWNYEGSAGVTYLVLGPVRGTLDLALADAKLVGEDGNNVAASVARGGDVNGDGHDDILVGALGNDEGGKQAGAAYLVLGPVTGTRDLSLADAKLVGERREDYAGMSVSGAGDVNDDAHDDLLIGAPAFKDWTGAAYVVLGPATGTVDSSRADAKLVGEGDNDRAAVSVSGAGDVDGDGRADLLVGAPNRAEGNCAYVVYGGNL